MTTNTVKLLTVPAEAIFGNGVQGILRGWLENNGELTVKTPTAVDTLTALKIMSAFDRLAQDDGRLVMGCAFVSTKK